ncbi:MAG: retroviral-like aspartic protease family protein [Chloroflexota bacterium]
MQNITTFDTFARYIHLPIYVTTHDGKRHKFDAILDTAAPSTEFSDEALETTGLLESKQEGIQLRPGLQTQKYGRVVIPRIEICSHTINDLDVYVSHFDKSWGVKALIGLDFFRRFRTTIDYEKGEIVTEPLIRK